MKKSAFKAILCYILCLVLIAGYSTLHAYRPEIDHYDFAPEVNFDYRDPIVIISSTSMCSGWFAANAEGQKLRYISTKEARENLSRLYDNKKITWQEFESLRSKLNNSFYGNMKYEPNQAMGSWPSAIVPFSKTIITRTIPMPQKSLFPGRTKEMTTTERLRWEEQWRKERYKYLSPSSCQTLFRGDDGDLTANLLVSGFSGSIIFHSDNAVELYGDTKDVTVTIETEGTMWTVRGSGGLYAKVAVVDGEIKAEGLTSYEVERE